MGYESRAEVYVGFKIKLFDLITQINDSNRDQIVDWIHEDGFIGDVNITDKLQEVNRDFDGTNPEILNKFHSEFFLIPLTRICESDFWGHDRVAVCGTVFKLPNVTGLKSKLRKKYKWLKHASLEMILRQSGG
jgi:hypothetical protein